MQQCHAAVPSLSLQPARQLRGFACQLSRQGSCESYVPLLPAGYRTLIDRIITGVMRLRVLYMGMFRLCRPNSANATLLT